MSKSRVLFASVFAVAAMAIAAPALAGSHLWRFNEIFSNPDGTIQFVELKESMGAAGETALAGKDVTSDISTFVFPGNLVPPTSDKHLLLATQAFADLPGAPTPDYIIPENFFCIPGSLEAPCADGGTFTYWLYAAATWNYDPASVPINGIRSLAIDGSVAVNSPTNYAGETGSVQVQCVPADININAIVDVVDLLALLGAWGPCVGCAEDLDDDDAVTVTDLLALLAAWGPCT